MLSEFRGGQTKQKGDAECGFYLEPQPAPRTHKGTTSKQGTCHHHGGTRPLTLTSGGASPVTESPGEMSPWPAAASELPPHNKDSSGSANLISQEAMLPSPFLSGASTLFMFLLGFGILSDENQALLCHTEHSFGKQISTVFSPRNRVPP